MKQAQAVARQAKYYKSMADTTKTLLHIQVEIRVAEGVEPSGESLVM